MWRKILIFVVKVVIWWRKGPYVKTIFDELLYFWV